MKNKRRVFIGREGICCRRVDVPGWAMQVPCFPPGPCLYQISGVLGFTTLKFLKVCLDRRRMWGVRVREASPSPTFFYWNLILAKNVLL